jgi:type 1 glutamine amidotransferase
MDFTDRFIRFLRISVFANRFFLTLIPLFSPLLAAAPFKVFMVASTRSDHIATCLAAKKVLAVVAGENNFTVDYTTDTGLINDANLAKYQVFLQMSLAPWEMSAGGQKAFEKFINQKKGWVGVHFAGLIRPDHFPPGMPYWKWYEDFLGGVTYAKHASLQKGTLKFEDRKHPAMKNMPATLQIIDEWYEFSSSPRPRVHVLATADEGSYKTSTPMGDHPLIWSNQKYPRMIYVGAGHDTSDWSNPTYVMMMRDALLWAGTSDSVATGITAGSKAAKAVSKSAWVESGHIFYQPRGLESGGNPISSGAGASAQAGREAVSPILFDSRGRVGEP